MTTQLRPLQAEFETHVWESANRSFHQSFMLLDLSCEFDPRPGIAIFTNAQKDDALALTVDDLRAEIDALRAAHTDLPVLYWRLYVDMKERDAVARQLGARPRFVG